VADLIDASTEAAARSAARSLDGAVLARDRAARREDRRAAPPGRGDARFPEEEIEFLERAGARRRLAEAKAQIVAVLATARQGALLNEGIRVVLAGQPNVGKSSLLNALAGAELAIVTDIPGTTRDKVGETIQIEGVPVHVTDTAGLREAATPSRRSASPAPGLRSARPTRWCGCAT
jgi:tRNA modification GTPase